MSKVAVFGSFVVDLMATEPPPSGTGGDGERFHV